MRRGTKRMWSRRVLRAGWALAPILQFPAKVWNFFFGDKDRTIVTLCCLIVASLIGSCARFEGHLNSPATSKEIEVALKGNPCMIELMPRWQEKQGTPLTNFDLSRGKGECDSAIKKFSQVEEQKAAMKRLGAK